MIINKMPGKDELSMNKVKVVFWSGSGNTQAMADAVANGIRSADASIIGREGVIANNASDDDAISQCEDLGRALAQA